MIGIAVACMSLTSLLIMILHRNHVQLGSWKVPLRLAIILSTGWVFYLALTHHFFVLH